MSDFSDGQIRQWREFHPRAVKLLQRRKPFLVVANDEPYYAKVYAMIREHEIEIGRWSDIDERKYQAAQHGVEADALSCGHSAGIEFGESSWSCVVCGQPVRRSR